ncbi:hypothetical protein [uncultured Mucilaginibacter sp.]|uniref:hypothetical protein n=1 Tax=uncultured Mucilaginibacter sp. TaxID=797541 RepID=UPI0025D351C2|nr:hypothetical protein [uncultured Mucilaginibacter sp.]
METQKKGLRKFTESEIKINAILALEQISHDDLKNLTKEERQTFNGILTEKINTLKDDEKDKLLFQIENILSKSIKNQLWESNHNAITSAIGKAMAEYGCMPTFNIIAEKTGLSRQTVHKHLKDYRNHPHYATSIEQFQFMAAKVLAKVYTFAVNGDIRAAKLYFHIVGNFNGQPGNGTLIQQQNNYIQINGTVLSQESVKQLNPEQLAQIEGIIKLALPETSK